MNYTDHTLNYRDRLNTYPNAMCSYCGKVRKRYFTKFIERELLYKNSNVTKRTITLCFACYNDKDNIINSNPTFKNQNDDKVKPQQQRQQQEQQLLSYNNNQPIIARESTIDQIMDNLELAYESILQVIENFTLQENKDIEFYEAVIISYQTYPYLRKYLDTQHPTLDNKVSYQSYNDKRSLSQSFLNDDNRRLWKFKYELVENEPRVIVVSNEPLVLRWIEGSKTVFDEGLNYK
jgi:hypothetical protein